MSEYRKSKSSTEPSENLWRDKNKFEFLALMSVEECCYHLCQMETDRHPLSHAYIIVDVYEADNGSFRFTIFQKQDRNHDVEGQGWLIPESEDITIVSGKAQVSRGTMIGKGLALVMLTSISLILDNKIEQIAALLFMVFIGVVARIQIVNAEKALIEQIYTVLGKQQD